MNTEVLVHCGGQWVLLDANTLQSGIERARVFGFASAETSSRIESTKIADAEEMESLTGVPASWFLEMARQARIPQVKFGKYVRFKVEEVIEHLRVPR